MGSAGGSLNASGFFQAFLDNISRMLCNPSSHGLGSKRRKICPLRQKTWRGSDENGADWPAAALPFPQTTPADTGCFSSARDGRAARENTRKEELLLGGIFPPPGRERGAFLRRFRL